MRIAFPGEELLLRMRGNPRLAASPRVEGPTAVTEGQEESDDAPAAGEGGEAGVRNQQISLADAAQILESAKAGQAQAGADAPSAESLGAQLNGLLEIPEDARITEVNDVRVESPQDAIATLLARLEHGEPVRLTVSGAGTLETVVLAADSEQ